MSTFSYKKILNFQSGQAVLTAVIFFLAISLTIILGVATPILNQVQIGNDLIHSTASSILAESGLEDALYRTENGDTVNNGDSITVAGYTTTISVTSGLDGSTYEASSDLSGLYRNMEATISNGSGVSFSYGLQTGVGGFNISGGSTVNGSIYSNGPIIGSGGSKITGGAISANSASLYADQSNMSPMPITSCTNSTCITFGNSSSDQAVAESFQVSSDGPLNSMQFYLKKTGSPSNITVKIVADSSGSPSGVDLLSSDPSISASSISSSAFATTTVTFPSATDLYAGNIYWVVLIAGNSSSNYYSTGANANYTNGAAALGQFGGSWSSTSPSGLDIYFDVYLGGVYGEVCGSTSSTSCIPQNGGALTVGTGSTGNTWAHEVGGVSSIAGSNYCQVGGTGSPYYDSETCNTSKGDPSPISFPVSDGNFADWQDQGSDIGSGWTYNGSLTLGYQGTTTGALTHITGDFTTGGGGDDVFTNGLEVDGDMTISGGSSVTAGPLWVKGNLDVESTGLIMTGTIWVEGTVTVQGGGSVQLSSLYGANGGIIVTNGPVTLQGGSSLSGSGQSSSYILVATNSNCPISSSCRSGSDAIYITGGSGAIVLYAPYGTIYMDGGTNVDAMAADNIVMTGGATLNYNSGLVNLEFSSGPTGGYNVSNWQEVQ